MLFFVLAHIQNNYINYKRIFAKLFFRKNDKRLIELLGLKTFI